MTSTNDTTMNLHDTGNFRAAYEAMFGASEEYTLKEHFVAVSAALATNIGTTTAIGIAVEAAALVAVSMTGIAWLGAAISFLGWVCAIVAGLYAGGYAMRYVYDRRFTDDVSAISNKVSSACGSAWSSVTSLFKSEPKVEAEPETVAEVVQPLRAEMTATAKRARAFMKSRGK